MHDLKKISTFAPESVEKDEIIKLTKKLTEEIGQLCWQLYANKKHGLLIIFQGIDSSGKDSSVEKLFSKTSPACVQAVAWKKPEIKELAHDFLWRIHAKAPEKGQTMLFIRSHYEDVIVPYVNGLLGEKRINDRFKMINAFENLLAEENNTVILKFFLHISKDEQENQLNERMENPEKFWKHNDADWEERKKWETYQEIYQWMVNEGDISWHVIPMDQRWYGQYVMAGIIVDALRSLQMSWPPLVE